MMFDLISSVNYLDKPATKFVSHADILQKIGLCSGYPKPCKSAKNGKRKFLRFQYFKYIDERLNALPSGLYPYSLFFYISAHSA